MLDKLRRLLARPASRRGGAPYAAPSLEGRPFTHALLARGVAGGDPERALAQLGPDAYVDGSFRRLVEDAVARTAVGLTRAAAHRAGIEASWGPEASIDEDDALVGAFGLFLALAMVGYLKQEGTPLQFDALAPEVARRFFQAQGPARAERYAQGVLYAFRTLAAGGAEPLAHWRGRVARLTLVAVMRVSTHGDAHGDAEAAPRVEHIDPMPPLAELLQQLVRGEAGQQG